MKNNYLKMVPPHPGVAHLGGRDNLLLLHAGGLREITRGPQLEQSGSDKCRPCGEAQVAGRRERRPSAAIAVGSIRVVAALDRRPHEKSR